MLPNLEWKMGMEYSRYVNLKIKYLNSNSNLNLKSNVSYQKCKRKAVDEKSESP